MMAKRIILIVLVSWAVASAFAQTPFDQRLTQHYSGAIEHSRMMAGKVLQYELVPREFDGTLYYYDLHLADWDGQNVKVPVLVRNLLGSTYFEFTFRQDPKVVLMGIYKKTGKWLRVKGIVPGSCKVKGEDWTRINDLEDYNELVRSIISEMDRNTMLACLMQD